MVNLDKWDEVEYGKIKRNDLIRCITVRGNAVSDVRGVVDGYDVHGVYNNNGIRFVSDPAIFRPSSAGDNRTIYRRKGKPFVLPTELGAIVSGVPAGAVDREWSVFDGRDWSSSNRAYLPSEMVDHFADLRLEREGIEPTP
jgi:hypothetical protein